MQSERQGVRRPASGAREGGSADPRTALALEALRGPRERFDSAVAAASDRLRALIDAQRAGRNGRVAGVSAELGRFASGRIDFERYAGVFDPGPTIPPADLARIVAAHDVLVGLIRDGVAPHVLTLRTNEDLRLEVGYTLARVGRVFGAARAAVRARDGMGALRDEAMIAAFAFRNWNRAEKAIAPPLVVELDGGDLRADGLGDFLDGQLRIVLVVRGDSPVAPLAEVISPSVFVAQRRLAPEGTAGDVADVLRRLADHDGPGIVALCESACSEFVHDPSQHPGERMVVTRALDAPEHGVGTVSAFRQAEGARLLALIAAGYGARNIDSIVVAGEVPGTGAVGAVAPAPSSAPDRTNVADRLAAWLLRQAEMPQPETRP